MGNEQPAEFYDGIKYMKPHIFERYSVIYNAAADLLPNRESPSKCPVIIDLGCGVGHFAKIVQQRGYQDYWGIDFSGQMIEKSKANIIPSDDPMVIYQFTKGNLLDYKVQKLYQGYKLFVLLEVLEHITEDLKILASIPKGAQVIFSLPSFDAKSHVRKFKNIEQIHARYKDYLIFNKNIVIPWKKNKVFLFDCVKK